MLKRFFSKKEVLLAVIPGRDGSQEITQFTINGSRILSSGEGVPEKTSLPMRAAIFSLDSYFEQTDINVPSSKMLPLAARRYVDGELVFQDEPYRLRARSLTSREQSIAADIAAMPELDIEEAVSQLPLQQSPCLQMVPLELAIAALVGDSTSEPAIVFWQKQGVLVSLLVVDGRVQTRMCERVSGGDRETIIARAESSLRSSAAHHGENQDIDIVLYMGELCDLERESRDKAVLAIEKKLGRKYRAGRKQPADLVLRSPEIFGLPLVANDWSFLEQGYCNQVQSWRLAKPAAAAASVVGLAFALMGGSQHIQATVHSFKFDNQRAELNQILREIDSIRPSDEAMQTVREGLSVQQQSINEVRLDSFLSWLTHMVPSGVAISTLEVEPAPAPRQTRGLTPVGYQPGEKPFLVNLEIMLVDSSLDNAEASSADIVRHLSQRLEMVDTRLDIPVPEPGVRRKVKLVVNAIARAESF